MRVHQAFAVAPVTSHARGRERVRERRFRVYKEAPGSRRGPRVVTCAQSRRVQLRTLVVCCDAIRGVLAACNAVDAFEAWHQQAVRVVRDSPERVTSLNNRQQKAV